MYSIEAQVTPPPVHQTINTGMEKFLCAEELWAWYCRTKIYKHTGTKFTREKTGTEAPCSILDVERVIQKCCDGHQVSGDYIITTKMLEVLFKPMEFETMDVSMTTAEVHFFDRAMTILGAEFLKRGWVEQH